MSIGNWPRQRLTEGAQRPLQSATTEPTFAPVAGFTPATPDIFSPPDSIISGQNVWVREKSLQPRWRLSASSLSVVPTTIGNQTNPSSAGTVILGSALYRGPTAFIASGGAITTSLDDSEVPIVIAHTPRTGPTGLFAGYANGLGGLGLQWSLLSYTSSTGSSLWPPSLFTNSAMRGANVYSATLNKNLLVLGGFRSATYAWNGSSSTTGTSSPYTSVGTFTHLNGAPTCWDVTNFGDRAVAWGAGTVDTAYIGQRVQWHVEGDPTDWTGVGSGFQDLADMSGSATRIFSLEDRMLLATDKELWEGRSIGLPYVFTFYPVDRKHGIPYPRAAVHTPVGIIWLDRDFMLYRRTGNSVEPEPIGAAVQPYLRNVLKAPDVAFLTYNRTLGQLRLFFSTTTSSYPDRSLTFDLQNGVWQSLDYYGGHIFHGALSEPIKQVVNFSGSANPEIEELLFTSAGTLAHIRSSALSDIGTSTEEEATFGTLMADNWTRKARLVETRYDFVADSASSVTVSMSTTFGQTTSWSTRLSLSAGSSTSQLVQYPKVSGGPYWTPRIQSTNGAWKLRRVYTKLEDDGEAR